MIQAMTCEENLDVLGIIIEAIGDSRHFLGGGIGRSTTGIEVNVKGTTI